MEPQAKESVFLIEADNIRPNPQQPRREFDEQALNGLAESIREYGILQPIVVSRIESETPEGRSVAYELIAGERRLRAAQLIGLTQVPAIIRREESDKVKLELALVENVQREDLNPLERARAYKKLMEDFGMLQREIGSRISRSREAVANTLRLLTLPQEIQEAVEKSHITEGHARALLTLAHQPEEQKHAFQSVVARSLSVRETERMTRRIAAEETQRKENLVDAETRAVEETLSGAFGAPVFIEKDRKGKGRIAIEFYSDEELNAITARLASMSASALETPPLQETTQEQEESFTV